MSLGDFYQSERGPQPINRGGPSTAGHRLHRIRLPPALEVMAVPSVDYIYWAFSAAAQSISAFVALLIAGYTLVHTMMEAERQRDDSLEEVHRVLMRTYHSRLCVLAALTGIAIVLSLLVAYLNRPGVPVPSWGLVVVALVDVAAIAGGLLFVVLIVDPAKYQRVAEEELRNVKVAAPSDAAIPASESTAPSSAFFTAFLHLERLVREYLLKRDLYVPSRGAPRMSFSFRQMIEALRANERITSSFYEELLEVNKYRNLVFHGHVTQVDSRMVERVRLASAAMENMRDDV